MGLFDGARATKPPQSDPGDPLVGAMLAGTYKIERLLAEGGMGRLYYGVHERLGLPVAVKVLLEPRGGRADAIVRAEREARAMASLVSPHVARVLDLAQTPDGLPCLVSEYLDGEDLARRIEREKKIAPAVAARITREMCLGLAVAHAQGVLHRDIKPSNVFLTSAGPVKVIDFGVAKVEGTHDLTHSGAFVGTPAYMSPEQAASPSDIDVRSEVYAVGAVLYHALAGQPPYGSLDATQTLTRLLQGEPPRLTALEASVPEGLAALVERSMSRDPKDRFENMTAMAEALATHTGSVVVKVEQEARWRRPRAIIAVATATVLAGLWGAALAHEIGESVSAFSRWPAWALGLLRASPAVPFLAAGTLAFRSLVARWRSAPRIDALVGSLRRTASVAITTLGAVELLRYGTSLFGLHTRMSGPRESIVALVLAALAGAGIAFLGSRFAPKTP